MEKNQLETILNYALQFRLKTKSNKFCRKWRYDIVSHYYLKKYILVAGGHTPDKKLTGRPV